jgi:hypothetical protein
MESGSARNVRENSNKFQDVTASYRQTVHRIVNKLRQTGS